MRGRCKRANPPKGPEASRDRVWRAGSELDRETLERPIRRCADPLDRAGHAVFGDPFEELLERNPRLEPGEGRPDAMMDALAKGEVPFRLSRDVEPIRFGPTAFW